MIIFQVKRLYILLEQVHDFIMDCYNCSVYIFSDTEIAKFVNGVLGVGCGLLGVMFVFSQNWTKHWPYSDLSKSNIPVICLECIIINAKLYADF